MLVLYIWTPVSCYGQDLKTGSRELGERERGGLLCNGRIIRVEITCGVCARVAVVWLAVYELVRIPIPILTGGTTGDGSKGRKVRGVGWGGFVGLL